ncbi:MAG: isoleucyl-tRNA synthetase [Candidatus Deianiraeaceae bacterium]|jgi:isoleucyl-tRNA synthetase
MSYKTFEGNNFPAFEQEISQFWEENKVFEQSVNKDNDGQFTFYDGPPFANGLPHYGHLLTSFIKDIYARYQTMQGKNTPRRFGWDCHGLPAEMEVEKQLGIQGRIAITEYGITKFNAQCRKSVMKYATEWQNYIAKSGRWVDFNNDYKTMDISYMESVIWAFKKLYEKGLIYEDYRVMPYSWKAETPLSNFETRMDNSYREKTSKTVTVKFVITSGKFSGCKALVWTTTPWTLPANLMLSINQDVSYAIIEYNAEKIILAENLVTKNFKDEGEIKEVFKGAELINSTYKPLFPYFKNHKNSFKIIHGDFVTVDDGTGIVHIAPGFGEDDYELCKKVEVQTVCPVDEKGGYTTEIFDIDENANSITSSHHNIETDNLYTKEVVLDSPSIQNFNLIKELYQDAEVRKFYGKQTLSDNEVIEEIHLYSELQKQCGYSRLMVFEKSTNEFVGLAGIDNVTLNSTEQQIGFTFHKKFWGKGYAVEIGKKLIQSFGVNTISAYAREDNLQSHKALEKLGFVQKGTKIYERTGNERVWFALETGVLSLRARQVFDCNDDIIKFLKKQGDWHKTEQYIHNYPHCWRTDTPLIYKAMPSWYVRVTDFKGEMVENNQNINWVPSHVKNGIFGKWLANARDWSISRNRFWGCPVPVWKFILNANCSREVAIKILDYKKNLEANEQLLKVFGSIKEMEGFFGEEYLKNNLGSYYIQSDGSFKITDLHRPHIDELTKNCYNDDGEFMGWYQRVEDVLDCWFESGSMPFASVHFPFSDERYQQNPENFIATSETKLPCPENFPADFIVEYTAQTRGWFYTLMVLGTALFGKEPFKNCICHGVILDENGQKLSKRLRNYPDPLEVFNTIGSDAMRYFVVSSPVVVGGDLFIPRTSQGISEVLRLVIKPIWNAYNFFAMYANSDGITATESYASTNLMDVYILSKLHIFVRDFTKHLDEYNTQNACKLIEEFIDTLNNWYIRRNKDRFWKKEHDEDKTTAYNTLYTVILDFTTTIAPVLPFTSEGIFQRLV